MIEGKRHDLAENEYDLQPGEYGKTPDGKWYCCVPTSDAGLDDLTKHDITEHEDGTITVSPSILCRWGKSHANSWHGYLERGVWREV